MNADVLSSSLLHRVRDGARRVVSDETSFAWTIFFVALVPRLLVAVATRGAAVWDGHYYAFGAERIADGLGYSDDVLKDGELVFHPWCHYPVGYSAFLALALVVARGVTRSFGVDLAETSFAPLVFPFANALTGAALAVVTLLLARKPLGERRARVAGLVVALHPGLVLYAGLVMSEPLAALLVMLAFFLASRARTLVGFGASGLVLGLSVLVRPQGLLCLPLLVLPLLMEPGLTPFARVRRAMLPFLVATAAMMAPVLPWTLRNCRVMDGCALVSTNGGWNLAIGSSPHATGRFDSLRKEDGCQEVTGQVQQDHCWFQVGVANIRRDPGRWLALMPVKWGQTFDHESFPVEYLREAGRPWAWTEERRTAAREALTLVHRLLLLGAGFAGVGAVRTGRGARVQAAVGLSVLTLFVVGVLATPPFAWPLAWVATLLPLGGLVFTKVRRSDSRLRRTVVPGAPMFSPEIAALTGLLASTLATHAIFFGEDRYHVFVIPALALLAAAAFRRPAALA